MTFTATANWNDSTLNGQVLFIPQPASAATSVTASITNGVLCQPNGTPGVPLPSSVAGVTLYTVVFPYVTEGRYAATIQAVSFGPPGDGGSANLIAMSSTGLVPTVPFPPTKPTDSLSPALLVAIGNAVSEALAVSAVEGGTASAPGVLIQNRSDTAAHWTSANPTLAAGVIGFETDTGKVKVGTGLAVWTSLPYIVANPISADLAAIAALTPANDDVIQRKSGAWTHRSVAQYRADLNAGLHVINVKDPAYGAKGDGVTDDSAAFLAAFTEAATNLNSAYGYSPDSRGTRQIYVPPGTYLITQPENFMAPDLNTGGAIAAGLMWQGAGRMATTIVFSPSSSNTYMLHNNDDWYALTFADMSFNSTSSTASFMKSESGSHVHYGLFNRCMWLGTWKYGFDLLGTNGNDTWSWSDCNILGNWTSFLHQGASGTSDQSLMFNFYACHNEVATGNFIDMALGGNINVFGGSLIHAGNGTQTTSAAQCFFKLGTTGASINQGVHRLLVEGVRIEHRHNQSQLIQCGWTFGNVHFTNVDSSAWSALLSTPNSVVQAEFGVSTDVWPNIVFDNCALMGVHKYHFNSNSWNYRPSINYRSCTITTNATAAAFIAYTNDNSTSNTSGQPPITFEGCIGNTTVGNPTEQFDCTVGWPSGLNLVVKPHAISLQRPYGGLPFTGDTTHNVNLPINAIITRVRSGKGATGSSSSTNFTYTLTDADSTVIATAAGNGTTAWSAGFTYDSGALFYRCTTTNKRTLTLTSANISQNSSDSYFIIDYLA